MYIEKNYLNKYICNWLALMFWLISLMIVIGGLTRLTDSGLSITQWQLFSGIFPPFNELQWMNYFDLYKLITLVLIIFIVIFSYYFSYIKLFSPLLIFITIFCHSILEYIVYYGSHRMRNKCCD